jgi:hypothetical protein
MEKNISPCIDFLEYWVYITKIVHIIERDQRCSLGTKEGRFLLKISQFLRFSN